MSHFNRDSCARNSQRVAVNRLCIFIGTMVGGYVGWYLGELGGLGFGGAFVVSGIGSIVGVYGGWKLARKFEE